MNVPLSYSKMLSKDTDRAVIRNGEPVLFGRLVVIAPKHHLRVGRDKYVVSGGFAALMCEFARHVKEVHLCVVVEENAPPDQKTREFTSYPDNVRVVSLPFSRSRASLFLTLPRTVATIWREVGKADLVFPQLPKTISVIGLLVSRLRDRPAFLAITGDRAAIVRLKHENRWFGLLKSGTTKLVIYNSIKLLGSRCPAFVSGAVFFGRSPHWKAWIKTTDRSADVPPLRCGSYNRNDKMQVVFAGRISPEKNLYCLLNAARLLNESGEGVSVCIVGEGGPLVDTLKHYCRDFNIPDVHFAGYVENSYLKRTAFLGADVLVLPSKQEGSPKVLLEAMARSVPIVAARAGGIPKIVRHEETGLLFDPESPNDLACALKRVSDPRLRERLVTNGYHFARSNSLDKTVAKIVGEVVSFYGLAAALRNTGNQVDEIR